MFPDILYKMTFMVFDNGKNEAHGTWRAEETGRYSLNFRGCQGIRLPGAAIRNQSLRVSRANREGSNFSNGSGDSAAGGILSQLIEETSNQLAFHLEQAEKLRERLEGIEALRQQLKEKTNE